MEKNRLIKAAIAFNALIVVLELGAGIYDLGFRGIGALAYYTVLSNLFGGIACAVCLVCEVRELRTGGETPRVARSLKYASACCLLMTFTVVVFVLAPIFCAAGMNGYYLMFCERELPITHFLGPLLVNLSYVLFEADPSMSFRQSFVGFIPTVLYAAVAYPCNILQLWYGPYPFFYVWEMPVWQSVAWFSALCVLAIGLCQIPRLLGRRFARRFRA